MIFNPVIFHPIARCQKCGWKLRLTYMWRHGWLCDVCKTRELVKR